MMKKFSSGISTLDTQLTGGFPSGSLILLMEEPGAGADILSFHFAMQGLKKGEKVLYVTTDDSAEHLIEHIKTYFPDFNPTDNFEICSFIVSKKLDPKAYIHQTKHDPLRFLKLKLSSDDSYERIVINSLNHFILNYDTREVLEFLRELSLKVKDDDSIALVIFTKALADKRVENTIKSIADGILELDIYETDDEIHRRLKVLKLKRSLIPKNMFRYDITDRGIRIESLMRVI